MKGYCGLVAYADDFVACFQYKREAESFYEHLKKRMEHFGLSLEEEKSRQIEFGRCAQENAEKRGKKAATFDFLGFTHYCSKSRNGRFGVRRKTSKKKSAKKCKEMYRLIQKIRNWPLREIIKKVNQILTSYFHYYGITDNSRSIGNFRFQVIKMLYHWLNQRSQKKSYSWKGYDDM